MNKNSENADDRIDRFLQAEQDGLKPKFSNADLACKILSGNRSGRSKNPLLSFSILGLAACLAFALFTHFSQPKQSVDSLSRRSQVEPLFDSDKELLEDLLTMPQEMNGEALPDESTFDLLVMLDQPLE